MAATTGTTAYFGFVKNPLIIRVIRKSLPWKTPVVNVLANDLIKHRRVRENVLDCLYRPRDVFLSQGGDLDNHGVDIARKRRTCTV